MAKGIRVADKGHLALLKQDVSAFNQWREENPGIRPNLSGTDLSGADLSGAVLWSTNLSGADLSGADLSGADLSGADLSGADLWSTKLSGAKLSGVNLSEMNLSGADLSGTDLRKTEFSGAKLNEAKLSKVNFNRVSFIDAYLDNAILTGSRLWETQRAGWSIKGVKCEYAFFDRYGNQEIHFADGEYERLYSEKIIILLHYKGGIKPIELFTLPALIQQLEKDYEGCNLRLQSVQDDAGGATVTLEVDELGQHDIASLRASAEEFQQLQLELQEEKTLRHKLEGKIELMREELCPILERKLGDTYNINTAYGPVGPKGRITKQNIYNQNDLAAISNLIEEIQVRQSSLDQDFTTDKITEIHNSLSILQEQITSQTTDHSVIQSTLKSLKTIFEGAAGSVVASGWLEMIQRFA